MRRRGTTIREGTEEYEGKEGATELCVSTEVDKKITMDTINKHKEIKIERRIEESDGKKRKQRSTCFKVALRG